MKNLSGIITKLKSLGFSRIRGCEDLHGHNFDYTLTKPREHRVTVSNSIKDNKAHVYVQINAYSSEFEAYLYKASEAFIVSDYKDYSRLKNFMVNELNKSN